MELNRRQFVNLATGSVATCLLGGIVPTVGNSDPPIEDALVFATNMLKLELSLEKRQEFSRCSACSQIATSGGYTPGVPVQPDFLHA